MQEQKVKKIPMRQCLGCNEHKPKRELVRVVRLPDGECVLDLKGKVSGRGAYICPCLSCLKKAKVTLEQVVQEVFIGAIVGLISGLVGGSGNGKLFKKASNQYVKKWLSRNRNLIIKGTKYYIKSFSKLLKQKVVKPVFMAFMAGMITNTVLRKKFERLFA